MASRVSTCMEFQISYKWEVFIDEGGEGGAGKEKRKGGKERKGKEKRKREKKEKK